MTQNAHYLKVFNSIQKYLTLFDLKNVFVLYAKQIGSPVLTRFEKRIMKQMFVNNFSQPNNWPNLSIF